MKRGIKPWFSVSAEDRNRQSWNLEDEKTPYSDKKIGYITKEYCKKRQKNAKEKKYGIPSALYIDISENGDKRRKRYAQTK